MLFPCNCALLMFPFCRYPKPTLKSSCTPVILYYLLSEIKSIFLLHISFYLHSVCLESNIFKACMHKCASALSVAFIYLFLNKLIMQ